MSCLVGMICCGVNARCVCDVMIMVNDEWLDNDRDVMKWCCYGCLAIDVVRKYVLPGIIKYGKAIGMVVDDPPKLTKQQDRQDLQGFMVATLYLYFHV